jgi:hypothetical protein
MAKEIYPVAGSEVIVVVTKSVASVEFNLEIDVDPNYLEDFLEEISQVIENHRL